MDLAKSDFDFLDLSDLQGEEELNSLRNVLFNSKPNSTLSRAVHVQYNKLSIEYSSCSSSTEGPTTVSSSLDSLSGGECEMAPHSPQRGAAAGPPPPAHAPPPPPYAQPPPAYAPPPPHQWPVAPPNVYVSQVTANVNVHGYMGQYYQPPQQHFAPPPPPAQAERPPRNHRRDRRGKRAPSPPPPQPPPPYYVQYPPYYSAAQAQGAPLYHLPMYQPLVYGPYTYPQYYTDYPIPVEGDAVEKGPEEYPPEVVMEQEAVEAYYGAHYGGPHYGPPVDSGVEYIPSMYLQPPPQPPPIQLQQPPHQTTPHQFNVHAKNFVQMQNKSYTPQERPQEQKPSPTATVTASATSASVETIAIKDLKISNKRPSSPKQNDRAAETAQVKQEKATPAPKIEAVKTPQTSNENKVSEVANTGPTQTVTKSFTATASASNQYAATKVSPAINKTSKGPAAPFSGGKQPLKSSVPQAAVPTQQAVSTPKAPFGNRQKRDGPANRSPSAENADSSEKAAAPAEQPPPAKRDPPLPQSKAPMLSITLNSQGPPLIVTNKSPFGHSRKSAAPAPEPPPAPQPPPPAPTASDFPPPPTPRNRGEPAPAPAVAPQPQPAPGKSWASLFNKSTSGAAVAAAASAPAPPADEPQRPPSPAAATPPASINVQKPVAKVPPFDASPLQATVEKAPVAVAPAAGAAAAAAAPAPAPAPAVSYSEKTSVNAARGASAGPPAATTTSNPPSPVQKEPTPALPIATSPFADDPNSYRMGEFLSKYSLDHRAAALLPRGLTNRSNYCYVNAILQALIACPPFYNLLKALPYQTRKGKSSTPVIDSMVELCYEFSRSGARPARGEAGGAAGGAAAGLSPPAPPPLEGGAGLRVLRALSPFVGSQEGRQEDAEEFLGCLLNSLNDEMLELIKLVEPEEPKDVSQQNGIIAQDQTPEEDDDDHEWKVMGPRNKGAVERRWAAARTPVADIFRGRTRLRLHRAHAHAHAAHHDVSDAVQPFFTLQLDIERAGTVKEALEQLANKDTLEGVSDAWQQLALEQLPVVLLLHLKCFQLAAGGHTAKIVKGIDFPIDLKIDPKIMSSKAKYTSKQRLYKLFAVVYHEGVEAVKGHYVADTYHGQAGWIRFDDSTVTQVTDVQVLKPKPPRMPYLLMYRRHDTLPQHRPKPE